MKNICKFCTKEFEAKNKIQKYCSDECRNKSFRTKVDDENLPSVSEIELSQKQDIPQKISSEKFSKRTGLAYDQGVKCTKCGEPTWYPPCAACCDELRKNGENVLEETPAEITKRMWNEAVEFCNNHTVEEIRAAGMSVPNWKRNEGKKF